MFKIIKVVVMVVCAFMLAFIFLPTGISSTDVMAGYTHTLAYTSSSALPYQYLKVADAVDPYLEQVEETTEAAGGHVDYIWVKEDGTPVVDYEKTSTFPQRGGDKYSWEDFVGGSKELHMGTDIVPLDGIQNTTPIYQVAIWGGTVIKVHTDTAGWGHQVVIDHGNNFYTRYAHMGYGNAGAMGGRAPAWQKGHGSASSVIVKVGDVVQAGDKLGYIGTTGCASAMHAHVELILCPQGFDDTENRQFKYYYGGLDNILHGGKKLSEIKWYQIVGNKSKITDMADWGALSNQEAPE